MTDSQPCPVVRKNTYKVNKYGKYQHVSVSALTVTWWYFAYLLLYSCADHKTPLCILIWVSWTSINPWTSHPSLNVTHCLQGVKYRPSEAARKTQDFFWTLSELQYLFPFAFPLPNFTLSSQHGRCMGLNSTDGSVRDPHTAIFVYCYVECDSLAK